MRCRPQLPGVRVAAEPEVAVSAERSNKGRVLNFYLPSLASQSIAVLGEVLWDVFPDSIHLGGAPLNFGVHARRLGHPVYLISAVGGDELGTRAMSDIA